MDDADAQFDQVDRRKTDLAFNELREHLDRRLDHLDSGVAEHDKRIAELERHAPKMREITQIQEALHRGGERMGAIEAAVDTNTKITNDGFVLAKEALGVAQLVKADTTEIVKIVRGGRWFGRVISWVLNTLRDGARWVWPLVALGGAILAAIVAWLDMRGRL